jgi:hypothetical protein
MRTSKQDSHRQWDYATAELAKSHIDSLMLISSTANASQPPPSYRNYINAGSVAKQVTPVQSFVRESTQVRRSVSPARMPGYKPHILSHHSPKGPLKTLPM